LPFIARLDRRTGALAGKNLAGKNIGLLFNIQNAHVFDMAATRLSRWEVGKSPKVKESYVRRAEDGC
jgi:hypothetical protein